MAKISHFYTFSSLSLATCIVGGCGLLHNDLPSKHELFLIECYFRKRHVFPWNDVKYFKTICKKNANTLKNKSSSWMGCGVILEGRIINLTMIGQSSRWQWRIKWKNRKKMKRKRNKQEKVFSPWNENWSEQNPLKSDFPQCQNVKKIASRGGGKNPPLRAPPR